MDNSRVPHSLVAPLPSGEQSPVLIVSTYFKGATAGKGLGTAGYSYEFVRQLFLPIMKRWGEVVFVKDAAAEVEAVGERVRAEGKRPVHVGFVACQDLYLSPTMPNVVVPAWEFPDVPNMEFDGNPQNDWVATCNRCEMVWAHVPFTAKALIRAGVTAPVREVPVPMPADYFAIPPRRGAESRTIEVPAYVFNGRAAPAKVVKTAPAPPPPPTLKQKLKGVARAAVGGVEAIARRLTPEFAWRSLQNLKRNYKLTKEINHIDHPVSKSVTLSGYVYTSIFNPGDGRKNWKDLLTGFVNAMKDCDDATLVIKLVTREAEAFYKVYDNYRRIGTPHRCKVVLIRDYLSDGQMMELLEASSYYVTTTRAEGNCLPLMNYLAAGRPGITPCHSAIGDYFDERVGFVVESHEEPAFWPQAIRPEFRTTWARMVWPSFVEQLKRSYHVVKHDRRQYERLSETARTRMRDWLHEDAVFPLMQQALDAVTQRAVADAPVRRAA